MKIEVGKCYCQLSTGSILFVYEKKSYQYSSSAVFYAINLSSILSNRDHGLRWNLCGMIEDIFTDENGDVIKFRHSSNVKLIELEEEDANELQRRALSDCIFKGLATAYPKMLEHTKNHIRED